MVVPLFAARLLGREMFGQATLAITVGQFLNMLMLLGMNNAVVRYAAPKSQPHEEVGASFLITGVVTLFVLALTYGGGGAALERAFNFGPPVMEAAVIFAVFATLAILTTSVLQGLHRFFERGVGELLSGLGVLVGLFIGLSLYGRHFGCYVTATCVGFTLATLYSSYHLVRVLGGIRMPARRVLGRMTAYGVFSCLGNVGFILTFYIQPMMLNKLLSVGDLGLFRVYQTASITIAQSLSVIFNTVFFPKASASKDRSSLWRVTWRLWAVGALPLGVMLIIAQLVLIPITGSQYPLKADLVLVFGITALIITIQSTVGQFLGAEGVRGVAAGLVISIVEGILCIVTTSLFVPRFGLKGACFSLFVSYLAALVMVIIVENAILRSPGRGSEVTEPITPFEPSSASEITPQAPILEDDEGDASH